MALFVLPGLRSRLGNDGTLLACAATAAATMTVLAFAPTVPIAIVAMFGAGLAWSGALVTLNIAAQLSLPVWVRARANALDQLVLQGSLAAGAILWGAVADASGVRIALGAAAAAVAATLLLRWLSPLGRGTPAAAEPAAWAVEHAPAFAVEPDDGPVVVTIEYLVPADTVGAFRNTWPALCETRRRLGATSWRFSQSLDDAALWEEQFTVSSWAEHLRQHARATRDDLAAIDAAKVCHRGSVPPRVRHALVRAG
jgi:MFS family permease